MVNKIKLDLEEGKVINVKKSFKKHKDKCDIYNLINELEHSGDVYFDEKNMLLYPLGENYFISEVHSGKKGNKYIIHNENNHNVLNLGVLNKDKILYKFINNTFKEVDIVERSDNTIVSEIKFAHGNYYFSHYSDDFKFPININNLGDYNIGDIVKIKLDDVISDNIYSGKIVDYICNINDADADFKRVGAIYNKSYEFNKEIINEMNNVNNEILYDFNSSRRDMRKQQFFTIDGADAKDKDDAIAVEKLSNGDYILRVSIADVCQYVNPWKNENTYNEAVERGTSIYSAGSVIPMLPKKLSNNVCSLNERVNRLTKTIEVRFDSNANIIKYDVYNSIINSKRAFTYDEVNRYLVDGVKPVGNSELLPRLDEAKELSDKITFNRLVQGSVALFSDELKLSVNKNKSIININELEIGEGNRLIENFMIIANNVYAKYSEENNLGIIYRVHDNSINELITSALNKIKKSKLISGVDLDNISDFSEYVLHNDKDMNGVIASYFLLRSMMRAKYSTENIGHFGLGLDNYAQFTSPIRRLPDLINHIVLEHHLNNKKLPDNFKSQLQHLAYVSTCTERDADLISKEVNNIKIFDYLIENNIKDIPMRIVDIKKSHVVVKKLDLCTGVIPLENFSSNVSYDKKKELIRVVGSNDVYKINSTVIANPVEVNSNGIIFEADVASKKHNNKVVKKVKGTMIRN